MTTDTYIADTEVNERRRLRRAMIGVLAAAAVIVILAVVFWPRAKQVPQLPLADVVSIELELTPTAGGQLGMAERYEKSEVFSLLLQVLNTGREIPDHRCPDTGHVIVHMREGADWHYGLLSGHDERYYHFRLYDGLKYRIYRVDRTPYHEAMKRFGVERIDDARPEW